MAKIRPIEGKKNRIINPNRIRGDHAYYSAMGKKGDHTHLYGNEYALKSYSDYSPKAFDWEIELIRRKYIANYYKNRYSPQYFSFNAYTCPERGSKSVNCSSFNSKENIEKRTKKTISKEGIGHNKSYLISTNPFISNGQRIGLNLAIVKRIPMDFDMDTYEEGVAKLDIFFDKIKDDAVYSILNPNAFTYERSASGKMHVFIELTVECAQMGFQASEISGYRQSRLLVHWGKVISEMIHDVIEDKCELVGDKSVRGNILNAFYMPNLPIANKGYKVAKIMKVATEEINIKDLITTLVGNFVTKDIQRKAIEKEIKAEQKQLRLDDEARAYAQGNHDLLPSKIDKILAQEKKTVDKFNNKIKRAADKLLKTAREAVKVIRGVYEKIAYLPQVKLDEIEVLKKAYSEAIAKLPKPRTYTDLSWSPSYNKGKPRLLEDMEAYYHLERQMVKRVTYEASLTIAEKERSNYKVWYKIILFGIAHAFKFGQELNMRNYLIKLMPDKEADIRSFYYFACNNPSYQYSNYLAYSKR